MTLQAVHFAAAFAVLCGGGNRASTKAPKWDELKRIIQNDSEPTRRRIEAMQTACEHPNEQIATELVVIAKSWATQLDYSKLTMEQRTESKKATAQTSLLGEFVLSELPKVKSSITDHSAVLDLLKMVATRSMCRLKAKGRALEMIVEWPVPIESRRAAILEIYSDEIMLSNTGVPQCILDVFDASSFPALRRMVRQSDHPDSFNFAAASILAHHGDREIRADLEALRPRFLARHRNIRGPLFYYLWQIKLQHPPAGLLDYVASGEHLIVVQPRLWALRRAVELKLTSAGIRRAILTHASRNPSTGPYNIRHGLPQMKKLGLEFGVLNSDDLPDVALPPDIWPDGCD